MARVSWHQGALDDTERLYAFLWEKSPQAAERAAQAIFDGAKLLETFPRLLQYPQTDRKNS